MSAVVAVVRAIQLLQFVGVALPGTAIILRVLATNDELGDKVTLQAVWISLVALVLAGVFFTADIFADVESLASQLGLTFVGVALLVLVLAAGWEQEFTPGAGRVSFSSPSSLPPRPVLAALVVGVLAALAGPVVGVVGLSVTPESPAFFGLVGATVTVVGLTTTALYRRYDTVEQESDPLADTLAVVADDLNRDVPAVEYPGFSGVDPDPFDDLSKAAYAARTQLNDLRADSGVAELRSSLADLAEVAEEMANEAQELTNRNETKSDLEEELNEREEQLRDTDEDIQEAVLEAKLELLRSRRDDIRDRVEEIEDDLQRRNETLRDKLDECRNTVARLR